mmetsp:Transcript_79041/g.152680  ORF Transcript_79041/g.152680 Transcript_79041/m.152680 type:complete len:152 (+) Transcript_79041:3-458(+)
MEPGIRCKVGAAVVTSATGALTPLFSRIIHTVPPMYQAPDWATALSNCYIAAVSLAWKSGVETLAVPLLGAGARGAPVSQAAQVAAASLTSMPLPAASLSTSEAGELDRVVCLAVQEETIAEELYAHISRAVEEPAVRTGGVRGCEIRVQI